MHKIVVDRIHRLFEIQLTGPAALDDIITAGAAMRKAIRALDIPPDTHMSLYDLTHMGLVSDAAIDEAFREWGDPRFSCVRARKVALVAPSAFSRTRLKALRQARPSLSIFAERSAALGWLFAHESLPGSRNTKASAKSIPCAEPTRG